MRYVILCNLNQSQKEDIYIYIYIYIYTYILYIYIKPAAVGSVLDKGQYASSGVLISIRKLKNSIISSLTVISARL